MKSISRARSLSWRMVSISFALLLLFGLLTVMINESYAAQNQRTVEEPRNQMTLAPIVITETIKLTAFDAAPGDEYGAGTALSGDTLAVGAMRDDDNSVMDSGSVYIYERHQGGTNNWGFVKKL